jgi:hypothetical protein
MSGSGSLERLTGDVLYKAGNDDMPTRSGRPSSIGGIKRLAKELKVKRGLQHARALDEAARLAGYANFAHARRALSDSRVQGRGTPSRPRKEPQMEFSDFHRRARAAWVDAVMSVAGPDARSSLTWRGVDTIARVLTPIMGSNNNHTHLPGGGGLDMQRVRPALNEQGCLEFFPDESDAYVYLMKPKRLTLEFMGHAPAESFFHLELDELEPTGIYAEPEDDKEDEWAPLSSRYQRVSEDVVELGPHQYVSRSGWDDGLLPDGRHLPRHSRLVVRCFRGAAMAVAKGSLWNGAAGTYDGRHSRMTPDQIRGVIERALARRSGER